MVGLAKAPPSIASIYVFVILNKPNAPVRYFLVPGSVLVNEPERFTKLFIDPKFPGILPQLLSRLKTDGKSSLSKGANPAVERICAKSRAGASTLRWAAVSSVPRRGM